MFYSPCPDLDRFDELDRDDPATAEMAHAVERGEQDLLMLSRLAEIGMELAEALGAHAKARLAGAVGEGGTPLAPNEDPTGPFNKIAQTFRRIIALQAKIAEGVETGRAELISKRAARREKCDELHGDIKIGRIDAYVREALTQSRPDLGQEATERLLDDLVEFLGDTDDYDELNRPVGETVAALCKLLGLDPDYCIRDGDGWKIRREPYAFEISPSPSWRGTVGKTAKVRNRDAAAKAQIANAAEFTA